MKVKSFGDFVNEQQSVENKKELDRLLYEFIKKHLTIELDIKMYELVLKLKNPDDANTTKFEGDVIAKVDLYDFRNPDYEYE